MLRALVPWIVVVAVALLAWVDLARPFAGRTSEGNDEAHALVRRLAYPRVVGSDALLRALDEVEGELRAMPGVLTQRVSGWKKSDSRHGDTPMFVHATALVARLPGAGAPGEGTRIALSAHLDSVAHAPGVGDDLVGVAGVVEAMRHASRTKPRGDVAAVISAQEEGCVTCAAQLVASMSPSDRARVVADVVLVLDESGNAPPVSAFDALRDDAAGTHSSGLVAASPHAFGWTLVSDVVHALGLGVGRTEMTDLATRIGPDREGMRAEDRGPPVSAIAMGAMRGQRVYHSACDDLESAHPAVVDDVVAVARDLVAIADAPRDAARADVLAVRVPIAGTRAAPRVVFVALAGASLLVFVVACVRRRAHARSIVAGGALAVLCAIAAGVASSFAPSAELGTMARAGELQCAACLFASLGLVLVVRGVLAQRVDGHAFALGALGAAFAAGALPALLASLTYAPLTGFLTLACAAGLALAPFVARAPPHVVVRAVACAPLVVMSTQLAVILAANWWTLVLDGTGAPFVGLTAALLAGACALAVVEEGGRARARTRIVGRAGALLVLVGALVAVLAPRLARTSVDETCPPPVAIDYFHDVARDQAVLFTSDAQARDLGSTAMQGFLDDAMTRPLDGAGVERQDLLPAWAQDNTTPWRVRDVAARVPPPRTRLVRVDERAHERVWIVHVEPAQEPGALTLHDDDGPAWRSVSVAGHVAVPRDLRPLRALLLLATPPEGVDVAIATALDVNELHVRVTEQGPIPEGLLPPMAGRVSPSSGGPQTARASPVAFVRTRERLKPQ